MEDVLRIVKRFAYHDVHVAIVAYQQVSDDPLFELLLPFLSTLDRQQNQALRYRVRRGQEGRALQGYTNGARCYGYKSVPIPDLEKPDAQGRAATKGVKQEVFEAEAQVIRRIYDLYADGWTDWEICTLLNDEGVPGARRSKIGQGRSYWNCSLIKRILNNTKYIGIQVWNKTTQKRHPETGVVETRRRPESEWICTDPALTMHLRIVSNEQWERVRERQKIVTEKMTSQRVAGLNRAKKKDYLFSGLLKCGVCGASITVGVSNSDQGRTAYNCVAARHNRGCTNKTWIREDRLSSQLVEALSSKILTSKAMDYLVASVSHQLEDHLKATQDEAGQTLAGLEQRSSALEAQAARLTEMLLTDDGGEKFIRAKLAAISAEQEQVAQRLLYREEPATLPDVVHDLRKSVQHAVANLLDVMKAEPRKAKQVLQKYVQSLILTPCETEDGAGFEVTGSLDLFAPSAGKKGILRNRSLTRTVAQYTEHGLKVEGVTVLVNPRIWSEPFDQAVERLLQRQPDLLHTPLTCGDWAGKIGPRIPGESADRPEVGCNRVYRQFEDRERFYRDRYGLRRIDCGRQSWYMFSKVPPSQAENATELPIAA